ncbi:MAG: hypothetical protein B7X57_11155, partial [Erythrobacter sp. 34-65-8]
MQMPARDFSLDTLLKANAAIYAAREASIDGHQRLTWTELDQRTGRMAQWLLARGIGPGDRVALLLTDGAPFVTTLLACGRIGAIAVLLNWRLAPGEIGWIMGNAEVAMTFANPRFAPLLAESETGALIIVDEGHDPQGTFEAIVSAEQPARPMPALDPDRPLYMMYTSGTTGKPKGCLQSGTAVATAAIAMALRRSWGKDTRLLSVNPLFHVVGMAARACHARCDSAEFDRQLLS